MSSKTSDEPSEGKKRGLTDKQRKFIEVFEGNATEAARLAGYEGTDATLAQVGYENLRKPDLVKAIRERGDAEREARIATRTKRQTFWTELMKDPTAELSARLRASELLGKSEGDFVEKHEHSGPNGKPIETLNRADLSDEQLEAMVQALLTRGKPRE